MEELLKSLNEQQKEAVTEKEGALLVLAGAGSGKTKVLTTRIVNLVKSGINPYKILAVTFTNKAAKEMKERLSKMLGEDVVKKMWVGTFHNICGRILRYDIENYKSPDGKQWDKNYVIYDDSDTNTIIKNVLKKLNMDEKSLCTQTRQSCHQQRKKQNARRIHFFHKSQRLPFSKNFRGL